MGYIDIKYEKDSKINGSKKEYITEKYVGNKYVRKTIKFNGNTVNIIS